MEDSKSNGQTGNMIQVLDWAYDKAISGLPGTLSAIDLARDFKNTEESLVENVNSLIRWQISKTATAGFISGLGGLITLPVALPADIACTVYVQLRMIAAIAHLGGFDLKDDKVKALIYICLVGESAKDIIKDTGIHISIKLGQNAVKNLSGKFIAKINQQVGFRLVTKFGTKGAINLVKVIPLLGGIVGGSINAIATNSIGNIARATFIRISTNSLIAEEFIDFITAKEDSPNFELLKFYAYLNIIKIDGVKKAEEYSLFNNMINFSLINDDLKIILNRKLDSSEIEKIDFTLFKNNPEQISSLISNLVFIAKCDDEIHIAEKMYIKEIAKQLLYSEDEIDSLIANIIAKEDKL
jgi:uncharacterized tellurite resistance protein B-like protein